MTLILKVTKVSVSIGKTNPVHILVTAKGQVRSGGWGSGTLSPVVYVQPPADRIQDIFFNATPPASGATQGITDIESGELRLDDPENFWGLGDALKGVRVKSETNAVEYLLNGI